MEGGFAALSFFGGKPAWLDHHRRHDVWCACGENRRVPSTRSGGAMTSA